MGVWKNLHACLPSYVNDISVITNEILDSALDKKKTLYICSNNLNQNCESNHKGYPNPIQIIICIDLVYLEYLSSCTSTGYILQLCKVSTIYYRFIRLRGVTLTRNIDGWTGWFLFNKILWHWTMIIWTYKSWLNLIIGQSLIQTPPKAPVVSLSKKLYLHCLVLVDSRNGFEC